MNKLLSLLTAAIILISCQPSKKEKMIKPASHNAWSKNAVIYEVNIRQFTKEGTINAFAKHLPRLEKLGVEILWLMPIYPISEKNRKGTMGSYYAVKDYRAVNPEFGTMEDLKKLIDAAHQKGMKVILDWVANHTGWDNKLIEQHKEWYTQDSTGKVIVPAGTDWSDTADLNYENDELRKYMTESFLFWINNAGVDGFRCDVAGMVPNDFWKKAIAEAKKARPDLFWLAEWGTPDVLRSGFDMNYGWDFHHLMNDIAKGKKSASDIAPYYAKLDTLYKKNDIIMNFTSNHDENSWNGTVFERMGDGAKTFATLTFTLPGMPLIYCGQETGLDKRLEFFEKDEINWKKSDFTPFYSKLCELRKTNSALWTGVNESALEVIKTKNKNVFAYIREAGKDKVITVLNLSKDNITFNLSDTKCTGKYVELFTNKNVKLNPENNLTLKPWEYRVYVK